MFAEMLYLLLFYDFVALIAPASKEQSRDWPTPVCGSGPAARRAAPLPPPLCKEFHTLRARIQLAAFGSPPSGCLRVWISFGDAVVAQFGGGLSLWGIIRGWISLVSGYVVARSVRFLFGDLLQWGKAIS